MMSPKHANEHQESGPTMVWEYILYLRMNTASLQTCPAVEHWSHRISALLPCDYEAAVCFGPIVMHH
jgi:hypothetical protein